MNLCECVISMCLCMYVCLCVFSDRCCENTKYRGATTSSRTCVSVSSVCVCVYVFCRQVLKIYMGATSSSWTCVDRSWVCVCLCFADTCYKNTRVPLLHHEHVWTGLQHVCVCVLQTVNRYKGANFPIMNLHERVLSVLACRVRQFSLWL